MKVLLLTKIQSKGLSQVSKQFTLDVKKANEQFGDIEVKELQVSHDRFLILDRKQLYHLGASLKDLGKKWFAFSKMTPEMTSLILEQLHKELKI